MEFKHYRLGTFLDLGKKNVNGATINTTMEVIIKTIISEEGDAIIRTSAVKKLNEFCMPFLVSWSLFLRLFLHILNGGRHPLRGGPCLALVHLLIHHHHDLVILKS